MWIVLSVSTFSVLVPAVKGFCSAELLENKYLVPCNSFEYLKALYGSDFLTPKLTSSLKAQDYTADWNPSQLPYVFRNYDGYGKVNVNSSLRTTNKVYMSLINKKLTQLPEDKHYWFTYFSLFLINHLKFTYIISFSSIINKMFILVF